MVARLRNSLLAAALLQFASVDGAQACQCAYPSFDDKERRAWVKRQAAAIFSGDIIAMWRVPREGGDLPGYEPLIHARVAVADVQKGNLSKSVLVETDGGENGANCGFSYGLFQAFNKGETITLVSYKGKKVGGEDVYYVSYCGTEIFNAPKSRSSSDSSREKIRRD